MNIEEKKKELIATSNYSAEGITLKFNIGFCLHGGISTDEWWFSWDKLAEFIDKSLNIEQLINEACKEARIDERRKIQIEFGHQIAGRAVNAREEEMIKANLREAIKALESK